MLSCTQSIQVIVSIKQPARHIPFALRRKVEELVDDILQKQVIHLSKSPWASPIVLVVKKSGVQDFVWTIED